MIDAKHPRFPGLRVLVVEDYYLMAESTAMTLTDFGCEVVGPAGQLEKAMELAEHEPLDGALVDINLRGKLAFPVGLILRRRNIPFALVTGYGDQFKVIDELADTPRLEKPYTIDKLRSLLAVWASARFGATAPAHRVSHKFATRAAVPGA